MKLNLLLVLLSVISLSIQNAQAQTEKGNWTIGGQFSFYTNNSLRERSFNFPDLRWRENSFRMAPSLGYFVKKNVVVGANIGYFQRNQRIIFVQNGDNLDRTNSWDANSGIFTRKFIPINEQLYFFLEGGLDFSFGVNNNQQGANEEVRRTNRGLTLRTQAGISYFPKRWLAIEGSIYPLSYGFRQIRTPFSEASQLDREHSFSTGINGNFLSLGVNFFINNQ